MTLISKYNKIHQPAIEKMMEEIASEFTESIFSNPPNMLSLPDPYWVAMDNDEVIGTVAIIVIEKEFAILKKMMLKKAFRGKKFGVSQLLLKTCINWCIENNLNKIYLGTMDQFKAAQKFYEKNGFIKITENQLPKNFIHNPIDRVFYLLDL